jgi:hypothetical protein
VVVHHLLVLVRFVLAHAHVVGLVRDVVLQGHLLGHFLSHFTLFRLLAIYVRKLVLLACLRLHRRRDLGQRTQVASRVIHRHLHFGLPALRLATRLGHSSAVRLGVEVIRRHPSACLRLVAWLRDIGLRCFRG